MELDEREIFNFCQLVEKLRVSTGISKRLYAKLCGVTPETYNRWITDNGEGRGITTPLHGKLTRLNAVSKAVNRARQANELPIYETVPYLKARKIIAIVDNYMA